MSALGIHCSGVSESVPIAPLTSPREGNVPEQEDNSGLTQAKTSQDPFLEASTNTVTWPSSLQSVPEHT